MSEFEKKKNKDYIVFTGVGEKNEARKKMVTSDTPTTFEVHVPPIMKEKTERNWLRRRKRFFDRRKLPHPQHKVCGGSNTLVLALHALETFQLKNHYFKKKLHYYPQLNLQLTVKSRLKNSNTPNYNELNLLYPRVNAQSYCV